MTSRGASAIACRRHGRRDMRTHGHAGRHRCVLDFPSLFFSDAHGEDGRPNGARSGRSVGHRWLLTCDVIRGVRRPRAGRVQGRAERFWRVGFCKRLRVSVNVYKNTSRYSSASRYLLRSNFLHSHLQLFPSFIVSAIRSIFITSRNIRTHSRALENLPAHEFSKIYLLLAITANWLSPRSQSRCRRARIHQGWPAPTHARCSRTGPCGSATADAAIGLDRCCARRRVGCVGRGGRMGAFQVEQKDVWQRRVSYATYCDRLRRSFQAAKIFPI